MDGVDTPELFSIPLFAFGFWGWWEPRMFYAHLIRCFGRFPSYYLTLALDDRFGVNDGTRFLLGWGRGHGWR